MRQADMFDLQLIAALPGLRRYARQQGRKPQDVEDFVNDTLVNALRSRSTFEPGTNMGAWLRVIARNRQIRVNQKRRITTCELSDDLAAKIGTAPTQHARLEALELLDDIGHMRPRQRRALLAAGLGLSMAEGAALSGVKPHTHRSHLHQGRAALRSAAEAREARSFEEIAS
jgi:RNA polymerase sigma-70 factor (ECF subfamily)